MYTDNESDLSKKQWITGWNIGRYGKLKKVEQVKTYPIEWRKGYLTGLKQRQRQNPRENSKIKHLITAKKVRLNLSEITST